MPKKTVSKRVMGCRDFAELIPAYLAQRDLLKKYERTFVEEHRSDCEICDAMIPLYEDLIIFFQENPGISETFPLERKM